MTVVPCWRDGNCPTVAHYPEVWRREKDAPEEHSLAFVGVSDEPIVESTRVDFVPISHMIARLFCRLRF